jgi:hypothetical protein
MVVRILWITNRSCRFSSRGRSRCMNCVFLTMGKIVSNNADLSTRFRYTDLIYQMTRLLDQSQHLAQIAAPRVQNLVWVAPGGKVHNSSWSVNLRSYHLIRNETAKCSFCFSCTQIQEFGESRQGDLSIVAGDNADVLFAALISCRPVKTDQKLGLHTCSITL